MNDSGIPATVPPASATPIADSGAKFAQEAAASLSDGDHVAVTVGATEQAAGAGVAVRLGEHVAAAGEVERHKGATPRRWRWRLGGIFRW